MDKRAIDAKIRENFPFTHRYHNRFHLEMPFGLINDPNGLTYYDGAYHIFFQWNPLGCEHKNKCWAHTKTRDFVHYSIPELALYPSDEHDKDGCYSGCAFVENGDLKILYTCNRKENGIRIPTQRLGVLKNGQIEKGKIIIESVPTGITGHFRDPFIFRVNGKRYIVLGAQRVSSTEKLKGTVLIYEEKGEGDNSSWELLGRVHTRLGDFGYMWECPNLLHFGDYDVLMFCPQGLAAREFDRQNIYQSGYIVGRLSLNSMDMVQHTKFKELDMGFDFYAPQVFSHQGRHILIGWMGMPDKDDEYPTAQHGWQYSLTLPRELSLRQGRIYSRPLRELKDLRVQETAIDIDADETTDISSCLFEGSEILLDITLGDAEVVRLELVYGLEKLYLSYSRQTQVMTIDRNGMKRGGRGRRQFKLFADRTLNLQMFIDKTALEIFFQHGEEVASLFVFPEKNIVPELKIFSDGAMENVTGRIWELDSFKYQ